jgi:NADH:ubiquinone oxidoreductase subunit
MRDELHSRYLRKEKSYIATDHRRRVIPNFPNEKGTVPPQWVLDRIAEERITGKYNVRKSNLYDECHEYRSVNGTCGC